MAQLARLDTMMLSAVSLLEADDFYCTPPVEKSLTQWGVLQHV